MSSRLSHLTGRANLSLNQTRARKARLALQVSIMETLEGRQLFAFTSGIISTLYATNGDFWQYQVFNSAGVSEGSTTFHALGQQSSGIVSGLSGFELDTVNSATVNNEQIAITDRDYFSNDPNRGLVDNGNTESETTNGVATNTTTRTFSSPQVLLPASLNAGQTVDSSITRTATVTETGMAPTTTTATVDKQFTLVSNTPTTMTVDGITYTNKVFQVDLTTVTTPSGGSPNTDTDELFFATGVGLIEDVNGPLASPTSTLELESSTLGGGGSGGGGGGGGGGGSGGVAAALTPELTGALPKSVIAGQKVKINENVTLADTSGAAYDDSAKGEFFLSTSTSLDSNSVELPQSFNKAAKLKAGAHLSFKESISSLPSTVPNGTYHLLLQLTDSSGNTSVAASDGTITIAPPQIDLSVALAKFASTAKGGKKFTETIRVANAGNIPAVGTLPIVVEVSPDGLLSDATPLPTINKGIKIANGKSSTIPLSLTAPASGTSGFLIFEIDPNNKFDDINLANNTLVSPEKVTFS